MLFDANGRQLHRQEAINIVDPNLEYVTNLSYTNRPVCLVRENHSGDRDHCILKASDRSVWAYAEHIENEARALEFLRGVRGIPTVKRVYNNPEVVGLLKEFLPGEDLYRKQGLSVDMLTQLEDTVEHLHALGVANFEIRPNNVVASAENNYVGLADFGSCVYRNDLSSQGFDFAQRIDRADLQKLTMNVRREPLQRYCT